MTSFAKNHLEITTKTHWFKVSAHFQKLFFSRSFVWHKTELQWSTSQINSKTEGLFSHVLKRSLHQIHHFQLNDISNKYFMNCNNWLPEIFFLHYIAFRNTNSMCQKNVRSREKIKIYRSRQATVWRGYYFTQQQRTCCLHEWADILYHKTFLYKNLAFKIETVSSERKLRGLLCVGRLHVECRALPSYRVYKIKIHRFPIRGPPAGFLL